MSINLDNFSKAFTYTVVCRDHTGKPIVIDNVCLVGHGEKPELIFGEWLKFSQYQYSYGNVITVQEALALPTAGDHISLMAKVELIGGTSRFITHTTAVRDL
jgi:hypothetical protein